MTDLIDINSRLLERLKGQEFKGWDPFDMLNSRLFQATPLARSELARLAFIQLGKRSPFNLRPLAAVPRRRNPKGVALIILGLLEDHARTGDETHLEEAAHLGDWLLTQRSDRAVWGHACWGYHFDWQARAFFVPAGKPNIITTSYVAMSLLGLGERLGRQAYTDTAVDAAHFMSKHLFTSRQGQRYFAYIPGEAAFVHNASLWGAAWCAKAASLSGDRRLSEQALDAAQCSVADQGQDGAWRYGTESHHGFIDGFHTGYNLEALDMLARALGTDAFADAIAKGYRYYVTHFFEPDGLPKYYSTSRYPIDMHSVAQAIITTLKIGGTAPDLALCDRVVGWAIAHMYMPHSERFIYQKTRHWTNKVDYVRWTQAWSYYSLALYNRRRSIIDATD